MGRGPATSFYLASPLLAPSSTRVRSPPDCLGGLEAPAPPFLPLSGEGLLLGCLPSRSRLPPSCPQTCAPLKTSPSQNRPPAAFQLPFSQPAPIPLPLRPLLPTTGESGYWSKHPDNPEPAGRQPRHPQPTPTRASWQSWKCGLCNASCRAEHVRVCTPEPAEEWRRPS